LESSHCRDGTIRRLSDILSTELLETASGVFSELSATPECAQLVGLSPQCSRHGSRRGPLLDDIGRAMLLEGDHGRRRVDVVRVATACHRDVQLLGVGPLVDDHVRFIDGRALCSVDR